MGATSAITSILAVLADIRLAHTILTVAGGTVLGAFSTFFRITGAITTGERARVGRSIAFVIRGTSTVLTTGHRTLIGAVTEIVPTFDLIAS